MNVYDLLFKPTQHYMTVRNNKGEPPTKILNTRKQ